MSDTEKYCICRSSNSKGFMICCDRCDEWFHGDCIGITKKESKNIVKWYCAECLRIVNSHDNGSLFIVYKEDIKPTETEVKPPRERPSLGKIPSAKDKPSRERSSPTRPSYENNYQQENIPNLDISRRDKQSKISSRKKRGTKAVQCGNPSCVKEARDNSSYCTDECGLELAQKRLEKHFIPKWLKIKEKNTEIEKRFKKELQELELSRIFHDRKVHESIDRLNKVSQDIEQIKKNVQSASEKDEKIQHEDEDEEDNEECEEMTSAEVTKIYCVTCGLTISSDNTFKHWANCFKKAESLFSVSSGFRCTFGTEDNPHPPIFCEYEDLRKKQFCKRFKGICVEHQDVKKDKNEICGCPLNISQELELDGEYCPEKKSECTTHYQWDTFMKAQLNLTRLHHYYKLDEINEKMRVCTKNLENHYGGIIGLMLHTTVDERPE